MILLVAITLLGAAASATPCPEDHEFAAAVAHGIHSIKVNDIQFFFDPNFTKLDNGIPTINTNLTDSDHIILDHAPYFKSPFTQIGLQSMDFIMSQNSPDFYMRKANALEKIRHELHMHEIWAGAATHYKDFIQNPPSCDCLQDDLVIFYLKDRASFIRDERRDGRSYIVEVDSKDVLTNVRRRRSSPMEGQEETLTERQKLSHESTQLGTLEGPEQWEMYKQIHSEVKNSKNRHKHVAKFLFCKINGKKSV